MVELADTPDLGSGGRPCRFESCYPHQKGRQDPICASVAQLVEQGTENPRVAGSIPAGGTKSEQALDGLLRLFFKTQSTLMPLFLLFKPNPLCWALVWLRALADRRMGLFSIFSKSPYTVLRPFASGGEGLRRVCSPKRNGRQTAGRKRTEHTIANPARNVKIKKALRYTPVYVL